MSDSAAHLGYRTRQDQGRGGCMARMKAGLWMGFTVGGIVGLAYSGVQAIRLVFRCRPIKLIESLALEFAEFTLSVLLYRFGIRGGELMRTVGRHTINTGGSFGVFMLVAQAIRC